jgi:hypothetical protein
MNPSRRIGKSLAILSAATAQMIFASVVSASELYYHYAYLNLNRSECVNIGYRALKNRSLQFPSKVVGDQSKFAVGNSQSLIVVIDCSQVSQNGRITVMASSNDSSGVANNYAQNILRDIGRYSGFKGELPLDTDR